MSDDFEDRIKRVLNENVDYAAGPRRPAPAFRAPQRGTGGSGRWSRRGPWVAPLLAAACVAIVVGGTAGAVSLLSDKTPVTTQAPSPTAPPDTVAPAPTHTPTSTPSTSGSTSRSSPKSHAPGGTASNGSGHSGSTTAPPTQQVVVRPVRADGTIVAGYHTRTESFGTSLLCRDRSDVAVDPGIAYCGFGATGTVACWRSATPHYALCLRDPLSRELIRIRYDGQFLVASPRVHPFPETISLDNGAACYLPSGGAFGSPSDEPTWLHAYSCSGQERGDTFAERDGPLDGIDRSHSSWAVHFYRDFRRAGQTQHVVTAYFVGTAQ